MAAVTIQTLAKVNVSKRPPWIRDSTTKFLIHDQSTRSGRAQFTAKLILMALHTCNCPKMLFTFIVVLHHLSTRMTTQRVLKNN